MGASGTKTSSKNTLAKQTEPEGCFPAAPTAGGWGAGKATRLYFSAFSIQLPLNSLLPANKETTSNNNQNNSIALRLSGSKNGGGGWWNGRGEVNPLKMVQCSF